MKFIPYTFHSCGKYYEYIEYNVVPIYCIVLEKVIGVLYVNSEYVYVVEYENCRNFTYCPNAFDGVGNWICPIACPYFIEDVKKPKKVKVIGKIICD